MLCLVGCVALSMFVVFVVVGVATTKTVLVVEV